VNEADPDAFPAILDAALGDRGDGRPYFANPAIVV
jgi:hypothetical protein